MKGRRRKRPERPGRKEPGAEPRKIGQERKSPEGAKEVLSAALTGLGVSPNKFPGLCPGLYSFAPLGRAVRRELNMEVRKARFGEFGCYSFIP